MKLVSSPLHKQPLKPWPAFVRQSPWYPRVRDDVRAKWFLWTKSSYGWWYATILWEISRLCTLICHFFMFSSPSLLFTLFIFPFTVSFTYLWVYTFRSLLKTHIKIRCCFHITNFKGMTFSHSTSCLFSFSIFWVLYL